MTRRRPTSSRAKRLWLDYAGAKRRTKILENFSAAATAGRFLWTASDETRSIECLSPRGAGYRLHRQLLLDEIFPGLPGRDADAELDIEALDIVGNQIWICGSHCRVRRQVGRTGDNRVHPRLRARKSWRLLGWTRLTENLDDVKGPGEMLPIAGRHSLLALLARNKFLKPFLGLPSKENGLDIEGFAVMRSSVLLGLRGPLVDSIAIVVELTLAPGRRLKPKSVQLHFLDLGGLGVRDLKRWGQDFLVLAGPVSAADGPFRLFRWRCRKTRGIQRPDCLPWTPQPSGKPEGLCLLNDKLLMLYDVGNDHMRIEGSRYGADLFEASLA